MLPRNAKGLAERLFASHGDDEERDEQERADESSEAGEGTSSVQHQEGTLSAHGEAPASPTTTEADLAGAPSEGDRKSNLAVNLQQASDRMQILTKEFFLFEASKRETTSSAAAV